MPKSDITTPIKKSRYRQLPDQTPRASDFARRRVYSKIADDLLKRTRNDPTRETATILTNSCADAAAAEYTTGYLRQAGGYRAPSPHPLAKKLKREWRARTETVLASQRPRIRLLPAKEARKAIVDILDYAYHAGYSAARKFVPTRGGNAILDRGLATILSTFTIIGALNV